MRKKWIRVTAVLLAVIAGSFGLGTTEIRGELSTWQGGMERFTGYGGAEYYKSTGYYVNVYGDNGEITESVFKSGGSRQSMFYVTDRETGRRQYVYCLASGLHFNGKTVLNTDVNSQAQFMEYYNVLPETSRRGIALASILGFSDAKMSPESDGPVEGTNGGDFWMATQCIIWEYQQGLRTDPYSRVNNGQAEADTYYNMVRGKPAEKCYNYLLQQLIRHESVPAFATADSALWAGSTVELTETAHGSGIYSAVLRDIYGSADTEYVLTDDRGMTVSYLTLSRSVSGDNAFVLTSTRTISTPLKLCLRRAEGGTAEGNALFFTAGKDDQTMLSCTGTLTDPVVLYLGAVTKKAPAEALKVSVVKQSGDGIVAGLPFLVMWPDAGTSGQTYCSGLGYTDAEGKLEFDLPIGTETGAVDPDNAQIVFAEVYDGPYTGLLSEVKNIEGWELAYVYRSAENSAGWGIAGTREEAEQAGGGKAYMAYKMSLNENSLDSGITVIMNNFRTVGTLKLTKTSETGQVSGFTFRIKGIDPETAGTVRTVVSGKAGTITVRGLPSGNYMVEEILPEDSDWEQPAAVTVCVNAGEEASVSFYNRKKPGGIVIIKTAEDGIFDGVSFTVINQGAGFIRVFAPDDDNVQLENGVPVFRMTLMDLKPGTYRITENNPSRYCARETVSVTVRSGEIREVTLHNTLQYCRLTVNKQIFAEEFVPAHGDAVFIFKISGTTYSGESVLLYRTVCFTAADLEAAGGNSITAAGTAGGVASGNGEEQAAMLTGTVVFERLPAGEYTVEELQTLRYRFGSATVTGGTISGEKAVFKLDRDTPEGEVTYVNRVVNQEGASHTALCINRFDFSGAGGQEPVYGES